MKTDWKLILIVLLLFVLVVFTVQNYEVVEIQFLVWSFTTSRAIIIFSALIIGMLIGLTIPLIRKRFRE